jgi:hypothetical protein
MAGLRARVGERRKQHAAISIGLMLEIHRRLKLGWNQALERNGRVAMREVAEHAVYFLSCFCSALRGVEGTKGLLQQIRWGASYRMSVYLWSVLSRRDPLATLSC